jgi:hypothetical protein
MYFACPELLTTYTEELVAERQAPTQLAELSESLASASASPTASIAGGLSSTSCEGVEAKWKGLITVFVHDQVRNILNTAVPPRIDTDDFACIGAWRQETATDSVWLRVSKGSDAFAVHLTRFDTVRVHGYGASHGLAASHAKEWSPSVDLSGVSSQLTTEQQLENEWEVQQLTQITGGDDNAGVPVRVWKATQAAAAAGGWTVRMLPQHVFMTKAELEPTTTGFVAPTSEELALFTISPPLTAVALAAVPESYDLRDVVGGCASLTSANQGECGSCWAFAYAKMFSAGLCLMSQERVNVLLAEQDLADCMVVTNKSTYRMNPDGSLNAKKTLQLLSLKNNSRNACNGGNQVHPPTLPPPTPNHSFPTFEADPTHPATLHLISLQLRGMK